MPGSPLTMSGRWGPAVMIMRMSTLTTGPRTDRSTTSGRSAATRPARSARSTRGVVSGENSVPVSTDRSWRGLGRAGVRMTTRVRDQVAGILVRIDAPHLV